MHPVDPARSGETHGSDVLPMARAVGLLAPWLVIAGVALAAGEPGAATPQALVERLETAAAAGDLAAFVSCMTPPQRHTYVVHKLAKAETMLAMIGAGGSPAAAGANDTAAATAAVAAFAARQEPILLPAELAAFRDAILVKHGIAGRLGGRNAAGLSAEEQAALFAGVDTGALAVDLTSLVDSLVPPGQRRPDRLLAGFPPDVGAPRVDGDRAVAPAGEMELELVRLDDGRWYLELPRRN
jgi:hypothetical protein